jgi:hypothetical protein
MLAPSFQITPRANHLVADDGQSKKKMLNSFFPEILTQHTIVALFQKLISSSQHISSVKPII